MKTQLFLNIQCFINPIKHYINSQNQNILGQHTSPLLHFGHETINYRRRAVADWKHPAIILNLRAVNHESECTLES